MEEAVDTGAPTGPGGVQPGTLSAILRELVAAPEDTGPPPVPGTSIGRFQLVREIGRGGFGVVWEARDRELGRSVAFKLVKARSRTDLREERVQREAEASAQLSHDNVVALYDVGRSVHGPYLVMELLRGATLAERLRQGPPDRAEALRIFREVAKGIAHAHAMGVVHRDLKPGNVFLCDDGRVKVLDLGLAHAFGQRRQPGGTPSYMAPEQWRGAPEDERTDVFALGVLLYQLLARDLPFHSSAEIVGRRAAPMLDVTGAPALGELIGRMLEKDPVRRPRDAGEVLKVLEAAMTGSRPDLATGPGSVRPRRRLGWRAAAVVAASAAVGTAAFLVGKVLDRPPARIPLAVADVVNETGDPDLGALADLLATSLEQSHRFSVLPPARVLDLAARQGRKDAIRVDEALGREVARVGGVRVLLLPTVRRLGSAYAVELRAVDPVRDEPLFTAGDRATSKEALLDLLDRLSDRTRRELREDPAERERSTIQVGAAMTRSLEAYQHYAAGLEAIHRDGRCATALRELLPAVKLDPGFAAAHALLAIVYGGCYAADLSAVHRRAALELADRMPEKERAVFRLDRVLRAWSGMDDADPRDRNARESLRLAEEVAHHFPDDKAALTSAAEVFEVVEQRDRAVAVLRSVLELDPGYFSAAVALVALLPGRSPEALAVARRAVATRRSPANLAILAKVLLAAGADAEALETAREALRSGTGESLVSAQACFVLAQRDVAECTSVWERLLSEGGNEYERDRARTGLVQTLAAQGRIREARRLAFSVEEARRGNPHELLFVFDIGRSRTDAPEALAASYRLTNGWMRRANLAFYGDIEGAERASASLAGGESFALADIAYRPYLIAHEGRFAEAVEAFRANRDAEERRGEYQNLYNNAYLIAEALLAAGRPAEALEVQVGSVACGCFDPVERAGGYPRLALVRTRALEALGRRGDAVRELDRLIAFFPTADADLPLLVEARAMRARLAGG